MWLLLVSIYWRDLVNSRRRTKRLAEALLNHAEKVRKYPSTTCGSSLTHPVKIYRLSEETQASPALQFLEDTVIRLVSTCAVSFLLPKTWDKHGAVLHTLCRRRSIPQVTCTVAAMEERNRRLLRPSRNDMSSTIDSAGRIYRLLDSLDYSVQMRIDKLADECMELISDTSILISTVLQWASSFYREGSHRLYLITRLLRRWSYLRADIDVGIISCLDVMSSDMSKEPRIVFRIIAELVRSKTFSTGRYLEWLIATGSLGQLSDLCAVRCVLFHFGALANSYLAFGMASTFDYGNTTEWSSRACPQFEKYPSTGYRLFCRRGETSP